MGSAWLVTSSGRMRTVFKIWLNINFIKGAVKHYGFRLFKFRTHSRIPKIKLQLLKIECLPCIIFKKPSSEPCRIFICRASPGGFREATDWLEAELTWTQTVDSTFTPGVLWIYLMPWKCDPPTTWTVLSLGLKSQSNPHVILNKKRNKKGLAQGQASPILRCHHPHWVKKDFL